MNERYSVREAAAIAEVSPNVVRTALEKKMLTSSRHKVGRAFRHQFSLRDVLYMKLLADFPFSLGKMDKAALRELVVKGNSAANHWRLQGSDIIFSSGDIKVLVECKPIRRRLAQNAAALHWGKRRIVSHREIMNGEPVFRGTRIPLRHVAALFRKGVPEDEIAEDFPKLTSRDLSFAKIYARIGEGPGRPKKRIQIRRKHLDE